MTRVSLFPMKIVLSMSISGCAASTRSEAATAIPSGCASAFPVASPASSFSRKIRLFCPSRPMFRTYAHTRSSGSVSERIAHARWYCASRVRLTGLYRTMTKSASAAAFSRCSIFVHGVNRSDRLMTQKSCPTGAPSTALPLSTALSPGTVTTCTPRYASSSDSV